MSSFLLDLRHAVRIWRVEPVFTAVAVFTLALGVGVNLVVFGLVEGLVLRPLPAVRDLPRLATTARNPLSYRAWQLLEGRQRTFDAVAAWQTWTVSLSTSRGAEAANAAFVSGRYFTVLGVGASRGRLLAVADEIGGERPPVVISYRCWMSRFGSARDVVGRAVTVDHTVAAIVGVAAETFEGTELGAPVDLFLPVTFFDVVRGVSGAQGWLTDTGRPWLRAMARLRTGVTQEAAQTDTDLLVSALAREIPGYHETTLGLVPLVDAAFPSFARDGVRRVLWTLAVVAACVLLVACANVASLLLVRGSHRQAELDIRSALGAGRARLVGQLLTETSLLVLAATAVAGLLARWTLAILSSVRLTAYLPVALTGIFDLRVAAGALPAAAAATLVCGLVPAWRGTRQPGGAPTTRGGERRGGALLRDVLLATQVTASVALVTLALLFARTLGELEALPTGFEPRGVAMMRLNVRLAGHSPTEGLDFYRRVQGRIAALPGVTAVARAISAPLDGTVYVRRLGVPGDPAERTAANNVVTPGYFRLLGIDLVEGRDFDDRALPGSVVLNETLARRLFPGRSPVGEAIEARDRGSALSRVIGVVRDTKVESMNEQATACVYTHAADDYDAAQAIFARTTGDAAPLLTAMRATAHRVDPRVPVIALDTLRDHVASTLAQPRAAAGLVAALALLAMGLAASGLYGLLSFIASAGRRDVAVRLALGARPRHLLASLLGRAGLAVLAGLMTGALLAALAGRAVTDLSASEDPAVSLAVAAITLVVAGLAAIGPARRALLTPPAETLREPDGLGVYHGAR